MNLLILNNCICFVSSQGKALNKIAIFQKIKSIWQTLSWRPWQLGGLFLLTAFIAEETSRLAYAQTAPPTHPITSTSQTLADGIYLYGESPQPEQIGKAYMVFEIRQGRLIGAFYMPRSSFDCVYGTAQSQRLNLTVVNSYDQTSYPYTISLDQFHPIPTITANDKRILSVCKNSNR